MLREVSHLMKETADASLLDEIERLLE
jgi:hypothetical protein